jgi:microcystin-dependent protein
LQAISNQLGTSGYASEDFHYSATCMLGDIILSVNSYGGGGAAIPADGRLLQISTNTALFSVMGTTFGGDGITTFGVPDLRPFAPKNLQYSVCVLGIFPSRN